MAVNFFRIVCIFVVNLSCLPIQAKIIIEKVDPPRKVAIVKIIERINHEEDEEFIKVLDKLNADGYAIKNNAIVFDTQGGNSHAARAIGKLIRERRLNTFLAPSSACGSACIYALIGGVVRNVYGKVSVHRSSYGDNVPLEKIKKFTDWGDAASYQHIYEMGISHQLTDAILTTPHWTRRYLTEVELRRWSINATDRIYEEMSSRLLAAETDTSVDDVQTRLLSMIENCQDSIRSFESTQWDCIRLQYYWNVKKIRYDKLPRKPKSYIINKFEYSLKEFFK